MLFYDYYSASSLLWYNYKNKYNYIHHILVLICLQLLLLKHKNRYIELYIKDSVINAYLMPYCAIFNESCFVNSRTRRRCYRHLLVSKRKRVFQHVYLCFLYQQTVLYFCEYGTKTKSSYVDLGCCVNRAAYQRSFNVKIYSQCFYRVDQVLVQLWDWVLDALVV